MGDQVVMIRAVVISPDTAELVALSVAEGLRNDGILDGRVAIVVERQRFVRPPADRNVVEDDVLVVAASEGIGQLTRLVTLSAPQVSNDDLIGPDLQGIVSDRNALACIFRTPSRWETPARSLDQ